MHGMNTKAIKVFFNAFHTSVLDKLAY